MDINALIGLGQFLLALLLWLGWDSKMVSTKLRPVLSGQREKLVSVLFLGGFLFSGFAIYRSYSFKPKEIESTASAPVSSPDLRVVIDDFRMGPRVFDTADPFISLVANIRNLGDQSAVTGIAVRLIYPDGTVVDGRRLSIPEGWHLQHPTFGETIPADDMLDRKAMNPIPRGGLVRGRLLTSFPGLSLEALQIPGIKLQIDVTDTWDKVYSTTVSIIADNESPDFPREFPGLAPMAPSQQFDSRKSQPK